jgi:hypothetical protein
MMKVVEAEATKDLGRKDAARAALSPERARRRQARHPLALYL